MFIRQKVPWTAQPPRGTLVDWAAPLTDGLVGGFINPYESITKGVFSGTLPEAVGQYRAFSSASSSAIATCTDLVCPTTTAISVFILAQRYGAQPDSGFGSSIFMDKVSGLQPSFFHFMKTAGDRIRLNTTTDDDSSNYWETTTDWIVGRWMVGAYTWVSGTVPKIYRDGIEQSLSSSAGTLTGTLKPSLPLQINLAAYRLNGAIASCLIYRREASATEVMAISKNIWQIAAP